MVFVPQAKTAFKMTREETTTGTTVREHTWFPINFGNRPHALVWADDAKNRSGATTTSYASLAATITTSGEYLEILVLPRDAPNSRDITMIDGSLRYCEYYSSGRIG